MTFVGKFSGFIMPIACLSFYYSADLEDDETLKA